jgi:hypothetical protein
MRLLGRGSDSPATEHPLDDAFTPLGGRPCVGADTGHPECVQPVILFGCQAITVAFDLGDDDALADQDQIREALPVSSDWHTPAALRLYRREVRYAPAQLSCQLDDRLLQRPTAKGQALGVRLIRACSQDAVLPCGDRGFGTCGCSTGKRLR